MAESNKMTNWHGLDTPEDEFNYLQFVQQTGKILRSEDNLGAWQRIAERFTKLPEHVNAVRWWHDEYTLVQEIVHKHVDVYPTPIFAENGISTPEDEFQYIRWMQKSGKRMQKLGKLGVWFNEWMKEFGEIPPTVSAIEQWKNRLDEAMEM